MRDRVKILVDIDDVINNLCREWIEWLNEEYGTNAQYDDIQDWDMCKLFPTLTPDQVFYPVTTDEFWRCVSARKDAMEFLPILYREGYDIYLCTATDYRNIKVKYEDFVQSYYPFIKWDHVIVTYNKPMIDADFLIDDGIHNLENGRYIKILMTASHNQKYNAEENGMHRAENWSEVYQIIKKYAPTAEKRGNIRNV